MCDDSTLVAVPCSSQLARLLLVPPSGSTRPPKLVLLMLWLSSRLKRSWALWLSASRWVPFAKP